MDRHATGDTSRSLFASRLSRRSLVQRAAWLGVAAGAAGPLWTGSTRATQSLQGTIVIATTQNPVDEAKQALTDAYKRLQPNVTLDWQTRDWGSVDAYAEWLGTQLAAEGNRPDIVSASYQPTFAGYVNLDEYRTRVSPYTGKPWDQELDWDFNRRMNDRGERIMLASQAVHIYWFYNKDLFAKAGVEPPMTWSQLEEVCAKLAAAGITPIVANYQYQVPEFTTEIYFDQYHIDWVNTVRAQEGDWNFNTAVDGAFVYDPTDPNIHNKYTFNAQRFYRGIRDGELRFDTSEVEDLVANIARIYPRFATEDFYVISDTYTPFLQQQAAMLHDGTWNVGSLTNDLASLSPERLEELGIEAGSVQPFEWGTFENPAMEGPLVKGPVRSVESSTGDYLSIVAKDQQQTELSVDFAQFYLSATGYQPYIDAMAASGKSAPQGPLRVNGVNLPPEFARLFEGIQFLGNTEMPQNYFWSIIAFGTDYMTDARNLLKRALDGELSPADYARELQAYVTDNFDGILEAAGLRPEDIDNPAREPGT